MTKFSDLKLDPKVLKAITEAGYETPTPIQAGAIPPALEGQDVLGIAQTGTGKTASFTLPMITLLGRGRARARMPRSLVLCPTRELAAQVAENFEIYAKHTRLTKALLIGGVSFGEQDKLIDRGVDVLIATPGRLLDHFERGKLLLTGVQIMVVDEADRMLDMGFIPDIERIFQLTPFTRQTLFFSATMAPEIERITDTFLRAPARIEVARQATASETITQKLVEITPTRRDQSAKQKRELLRALIRTEGEGLKNAIIFCNRKTEVDIVAKSLKAHGFDAAPIHGDLDQRHRTATLDDFREGKLRFLVASDVAARGLDIPAVSHVINFDLPSHAEDYVHRIGRTGRAGLEGTAISLGTPADEKYLTAIEALLKQSLPRATLPEGFSLSSAAQSAPRPARENGHRERGERGRDRRGRRDDSEQQAQAAEAPPPRPEVKPEPVQNQAPREERREDRKDDRNNDRRDEPRDRHGERGHDRNHDRNNDRNNHDRNHDRSHDRRDDRSHDRRGDRHSVMGMGDHTPEFLTRAFRPGFTDPVEETSETSAAPEVVTSAPVTPAPAVTTLPEATTANADVPEIKAEVAPVIEAAPETPAEAPAEKPVRKRKPRATKPKLDAEAAPAETGAETAPEAAAPATDEPEAKPARKAAAKAPAKPRAPRKSRAKVAATENVAENLTENTPQDAPAEHAAQPEAAPEGAPAPQDATPET